MRPVEALSSSGSISPDPAQGRFLFPQTPAVKRIGPLLQKVTVCCCLNQAVFLKERFSGVLECLTP